jgi:IS30 family transposase
LLQNKDILIYGQNIKSITTDNGSEFWDWSSFSKSVHNSLDNIDVYFCNPYHSWEKGSVENFNGLIRTKFPKGTDFTNISGSQLDEVVQRINNLFRPILNYLTSNEVYNQLVSS